jgi:predicted DNA-binding protein with PD1-like motif
MDGPMRMGHMLAPDTMVAEPVRISGMGLKSALFDSRPDAETNFTLFEPVLKEHAEVLIRAGVVLLARIRPNEDVCHAIESLCVARGIAAAKIFGIGSLNEVRFTSGHEVKSYATEVLIREGRVNSVGGRPRVRLDIDVVDMGGGIHEGELVRGENPVCVTFELVIQVMEEAKPA